MNQTINAERKPLAILEGRPIFESDILYGLDGKKFKASTTGHRDFPICLIDLVSVRGNTYKSWLTDTHWKGQQILFWSLQDIPAPANRTLGSRLRDQLEKRKKPRKRPMRIK